LKYTSNRANQVTFYRKRYAAQLDVFDILVNAVKLTTENACSVRKRRHEITT